MSVYAYSIVNVDDCVCMLVLCVYTSVFSMHDDWTIPCPWKRTIKHYVTLCVCVCVCVCLKYQIATDKEGGGGGGGGEERCSSGRHSAGLNTNTHDLQYTHHTSLSVYWYLLPKITKNRWRKKAEKKKKSTCYIIPSTGHENNTAQPKIDKWLN